MATANRDVLLFMQSKLLAMGTTTAVVGEPRKAVEDGLVAIIPQSGRVDGTVLDAPREIHVVMFRRFINWLRTPSEDIEFEHDAWRAQIMADVFGAFTLGGNVAYTEPTEFQWQYGQVTAEQTMYRILDIQIAYRFDPTDTFAA